MPPLHHFPHIAPSQANGVLSEDSAKTVCSAHHMHLEDVLGHMAMHVPTMLMLQYQWHGMVWPAFTDTMHNPSTGINIELNVL